MTKGQNAEREAARLYEDAGFETYRPPRARGGPTDVFGLFDVLAFDEGDGLQCVQVKCNKARGIVKFCRETLPFNSTSGLCPVMLVRHDGHGGPHPTPVRWRVLMPAGEETHYVIVDEREDDTPAEGEGVLEWLERDGPIKTVAGP